MLIGGLEKHVISTISGSVVTPILRMRRCKREPKELAQPKSLSGKWPSQDSSRAASKSCPACSSCDVTGVAQVTCTAALALSQRADAACWWVRAATCALSTPSFRELDGEGSEPKGGFHHGIWNVWNSPNGISVSGPRLAALKGCPA